MAENTIALQAVLREKTRDICTKYGFDNEAFVIELTGVLTRALFAPTGERRQYTTEDLLAMTGEAIAHGTANDLSLREEWERLFHTSPDWEGNKANRAFLLWLKERPAIESLGVFASWWWANDWRGSNGQAPTTAQVRENWPQAFRGENRPVVKKQATSERTSPLPGGF